MAAGNDLADRMLVVTRTIEAPRALVFDAFTDPDHLARWWGPDGFSLTTSAFDMRPGGVWRFVMHGPDGRDYQNRVVFDDVDPPERIAFRHIDGEGEAPLHHSTLVHFEDLGGATRISLTVVFPTAEGLKNVIRDHKADEGGKQTLGRLAAMLEEDFFVYTRRLDAPRAVVWDMWTKAEHLERWWGPKGFEWISGSLDLRPGGGFHYGMRSPNGDEMWGRFTSREIVPMDRLVYITSFSDAAGGLTRAPWFADWPLEVLNMVTFTDDGDGTLVTLKGAPIGASAGERQRFKTMKQSMNQGFGGSFDQLERYLKEGAAR